MRESSDLPCHSLINIDKNSGIRNYRPLREVSGNILRLLLLHIYRVASWVWHSPMPLHAFAVDSRCWKKRRRKKEGNFFWIRRSLGFLPVPQLFGSDIKRKEKGKGNYETGASWVGNASWIPLQMAKHMAKCLGALLEPSYRYLPIDFDLFGDYIAGAKSSG